MKSKSKVKGQKSKVKSGSGEDGGRHHGPFSRYGIRDKSTLRD
jgi:hypothetical protein